MSDEAAVESESEETPAKGKKGRSMDAVALRELRRARKLFKDGEPTAEANFVVASANVLALLDLAAAIRESTNGESADAE